MHRTLRTLIGVLLVATVVYPFVDAPAGREVIRVVVEAAALTSAWIHLYRHPELARLGWGTFAMSLTLQALANYASAFDRFVVGGDLGSTPAGVLSSVGYLLLAVGAWQFERNRSRRRTVDGYPEVGIFAVGALVPLLVFVVLPIVSDERFSVAGKVGATAQSVADLAVLVVVARLFVTVDRQPPAFFFMTGAVLVTVMGDFWWAADVAIAGPDPAMVPGVEALWLASFVLFAGGVLHPSLRRLTHSPDGHVVVSSKMRVWIMAVGQGLPALTLAVALLTGIARDSWMVIAVGGFIVTLLNAARVTSLLGRIGEQSRQLAELARSDDLTGLHNRRSWKFELDRATAEARRRRRPLTIALLDLDHFKAFNDSFGHPAGDALLREAARTWREALGPHDVLARYGGEEFSVILPNTTLSEGVARIDALRACTPGGQTFSAGVAAWTPGTDPEVAVACADETMYRAKHAGRNRVLAASLDDTSDMPLIAELGLSMVLQPVRRSPGLRVVGYEALSRFARDPDVVAVFAAAHDEGYGDLVEVAAIQEAVAMPGRPPGCALFVNVSERAMRSDRFWAGLPKDLTGVVVELHEDRDGLDDDAVARLLSRFRERGAMIALDDVGVTAHELARVVTLGPDILKIDRSLIAGCDVSEGQADVVRMLVEFGAAHDLEVCVEGVETLGELEVVIAVGATYIQGYLTGRPVPGWSDPPVPAGPRMVELVETTPRSRSHPGEGIRPRRSRRA